MTSILDARYELPSGRYIADKARADRIWTRTLARTGARSKLRGITRQSERMVRTWRADIANREGRTHPFEVPHARAAYEIVNGAYDWADFAARARTHPDGGFMGRRAYLLTAAARELTREGRAR